MCDFDDDFGDDFEDDGFMDDGAFDEDLSSGDDPLQDDGPNEVDHDESCGPGWEDIAFLGAMSEEISEEKRRREQLRREMDRDEAP